MSTHFLPSPLSSPIFSERVSFLAQSQYWPEERLRDWQLRQLQWLVWHVEHHVPFYAEFLKEKGLSWQDFTKIEDLRHFPVIDKKIIQAMPEAFLLSGVNRERLIHRTTGGSTGTPLTVWADIDFLSRDKANTQHYMEVFGLDIFSYRSVRLYGDRVEAALIDRGEFWRMDDGRKLVMSPYHINQQTAASYVDAIAKHRPRYIHTRASAILPLARYMLRDDLQLPEPIRFIFCDGEYLTHGQRRLIEQAFQARLLNIYGHTEGALVGHPCPYSDSLHFMPQVGILELLDKEGHEVTDVGAKGEMVATGFNNKIFPLIRYRTGDIAIQGDEHCPCGRHYRVIAEVEGRIQDYVVDAKGDLVPLAPAIFNYNDMDWKGVREFKVIQESRGELILLVDPEEEMRAQGNAALQGICEKIGAILGPNFRLSASFVDSLPKTTIGKYRYLDQKLEIRELLA
jgi:phenylacetate-CoA ligase